MKISPQGKHWLTTKYALATLVRSVKQETRGWVWVTLTHWVSFSFDLPIIPVRIVEDNEEKITRFAPLVFNVANQIVMSYWDNVGESVYS